MRTPAVFPSNVRTLASAVKLGLAGLFAAAGPSCVADVEGRGAGPSDPSLEDAAPGGDEPLVSVCTRGTYRCHAYARAVAPGSGFRPRAARPFGYGPRELQNAYRIDPSSPIIANPTVAIVVAYGYSAIESDLAAYRTYYGLPPCTFANGCLRVVNQLGQTAPLPPDPPTDDDWTVEAALDIDMVSAACPTCDILVVQASDNGEGLFLGQGAAVGLGATVISNSWGAPEQPDTPARVIAETEAALNQPGVAIFVSAGDDGYNDGGAGPDYPGTSAHVIAVGGTRLVRDGSPRGWSEAAWSRGGSACSLSIPKPAYQTNSPCPFRASTDIAAIGDPATGVSIYNARAGGWMTVGGTSASAPFVAAVFAATGHGAQTSGAFVQSQAGRLHDVTTGSNGECGADRLLCNAAVGWDGPTGYGTPDAAALTGRPYDPMESEDPAEGAGCAAGGANAGWILALAVLGVRRRSRPGARLRGSRAR